jgi:ankyrin repeat protein
MEENSNLFIYIKQKNWKKFLKNINPDTNLNIKDEQSNYIIQYIILYNKYKILKRLLKYNIKLDFLDIEGRSIFFIPIKYNYTKIIDLLIENDNNNIGLSILNISDYYGNYPLHYTIFFNNINVFNKLLNISNINVLDKKKNTLLHIIIKNKLVNFFNIIINKNIDVNLLNIDNETSLHIASVNNLNNVILKLLELKINPNTQDNKNKLTPSMICVLNNNIIGNNYLLDSRIDLNLQDYYGNTLLHFAIIENNFEIINNIIDRIKSKLLKYNFNISNYDGNTILHIILYKICNENINESNYNIEYIIDNTNINLQNNNGDTSLHFIVKTNLFIKYKKLLINKKNNFFIYNLDNETPFMLINNNDKETIVKILINNYLTLIKNNKTKLIKKWEILCSKNNNKTVIKKCKKKIRKQILIDNVSIPYKNKKYCIKIDYPNKILVTTFTGILLDIITCYISLLKKHTNLYTSITLDFVNNNEIKNYYKKLGIIKELGSEFLNFEIFWIFQKIIFPTNIEETLNIFKNNSKEIMGIPIAIDLEDASHANILIIDKTYKTIERFEPNGYSEPTGFNYNNTLLDFILKSYFYNFFPDYEYLEPIKFLPYVGFQLLESYEKNKNIGDPSGFCVGWCLWYLEQRVKYRLIDPIKIAYKLIIFIKSKNISFKLLIRSYINDLLYTRNNILTNKNVDINDIINENITYKQIIDIQNEIKKEIINFL